MAKRKRNEDEDSPEDLSDTNKTHYIQKRISRGTQELASALEQARRFERQKLGRREHNKGHRGRQDDTNSRKTQVDIALLKALDMRDIARKRLHRDLVKTPSIAKTGLLPEDVKLPGGGTVDKATADIMARLFKQRAVMEALERIMTDVRMILKLQINSAASKAQRTVSLFPDDMRTTKQTVFSSSSSEDDGKEEEDEDENSNDLRVASASVSESEFDDDDDDEHSIARPKPTASAFLPSLSMTGYLSASDSDSEATDVEDHIAPRKNRRGQRARQAIWEKKFKEQAKHLKTPKTKDQRDEGWDLQRGAVGGEGEKGGKRKYGLGKPRSSGGNTAPTGDRKEMKQKKDKHRDDAGPLHPSWVAKKQAKQQDIGVGGFKGKKMTFD